MYGLPNSIHGKLQKRTFCIKLFKWVELPSGCVVSGSCVYKLLATVLSTFVGDCLGVPFWLSGSPGKEHHARLVQDSVKLTGSEQQVHL